MGREDERGKGRTAEREGWEIEIKGVGKERTEERSKREEKGK